MRRFKVAFASCVSLPEPDPDREILLAAASARGLQASTPCWDDPSVDWTQFDLIVPRSTWNYYEEPEAFCNWIRTVESQTRLLNTGDLIQWNLHKRYLVDLLVKGVPVVPTRFVEKGSQLSLANAISGRGWKGLVIKPAISAGSFKTFYFAGDEFEIAEALWAEALEDRDMMVQPYLPEVQNGGEIALVHIAGELTHGVVKQPRFSGGEESVSEAVPPTEAQAAIASVVMGCLDTTPLYARIDLMRASNGQWVLSELELIEPSLFFVQSPSALNQFVKQIVFELKKVTLS